MHNESHIVNRLLLGGVPCLDYCNTVDAHDSEAPVNFLVSYHELVRWSVHAGMLSQNQGEPLLQEAERQAPRAAQVLAQALALREAIHQLFKAVAREIVISPETLTTFNLMLAQAMTHAVL